MVYTRSRKKKMMANPYSRKKLNKMFKNAAASRARKKMRYRKKYLRSRRGGTRYRTNKMFKTAAANRKIFKGSRSSGTYKSSARTALSFYNPINDNMNSKMNYQ